MNKIEKIVSFYVLTNSLKEKIRSGWKQWNISAERLGSVAEHIYGTCMLAIAIDSEYDLNIDNDSVTSMYLDYDYGIYSDMVASYAFTLLPDEILKRSNYLKFSREELKLMIPCEYFTEQVEEALDDEFVDVNQSLRYAMSSLLALYCNGVLKENEDKGNYIFENIMANRADLFRKEMFEELAINGQEMSKILIKEMNYNQK